VRDVKTVDNGLKDLFLDVLALLGYTVNKEGFIILMQPLDAEREITKILSEAAKVDVSVAEKLLPWDIIKKAKEMAEVYVLIYCIENSLRMFIKYICTHQYGDDYIDKIQVSEKLREKIRRRKVDAEKNKWLPIRGEDLFYLDIEDLGKIIQNNWELFENFFPNQPWITQKIKEIQMLLD
jgi:formyltetrahydrofolate synthetase